MLPFLKPRQAASVILERRKGTGERQADEKSEPLHPALAEAVDHIIGGTHEKDSERVAKGLEMAVKHLTAEKEESEEVEGA